VPLAALTLTPYFFATAGVTINAKVRAHNAEGAGDLSDPAGTATTQIVPDNSMVLSRGSSTSST